MTDVYLVGSNPETREILRALLRLHRYRVKGEAKGAKDAIKLVKDGARGILLLDAELADGNWSDVLQAAQHASPKLPVVLLSSLYGAEFETKAKRLGVVALLPRPFEIPELLLSLGTAERSIAGGGSP